jgi:glycosyltransferase involved in cell wall biosynthesis
MRVGLSVSVIQRGKSGVATYVAGLLRGLEQEGWPVEIVLFGLEEDRSWFTPWLENCRWVGVTEACRPAVKNIAWHQAVLPGLLRREKCDLLHIPSYRRIVGLPGVPQVATIHDLAPFRLRGKYDALRMFYGKQVVRRLARKCARIIAVSQTTANDIAQFFHLSPPRVEVIYNGIDHELFRPVTETERKRRLPQAADWSDPWWIYVARLEHPGKNHLRLLEAFGRWAEKHPQSRSRLVLAGADWHGAEVIHAAVAKSPWKERICFAGFVPEADLPSWYAGARALIFPSLFEGFGLPPLEAMACGCPVISSDQGSLREVVGEAGLLFNPTNVDEMVSAMERVHEDGNGLDSLREKGKKRAAGFRWEICARRTSALYSAALQG